MQIRAASVLIVLIGLIMTGWSGRSLGAPAPHEIKAGATPSPQVFMPHVEGGGQPPSVTDTPTTAPSPTPTPSATGTPPGGQGEQRAFFVDVEWKTSSASTVVDGQGGLHFAYLYYEGVGEGIPTYGVYAYCPQSCDETGNWTTVGMGERVNEIQLALTSDGRPRILYRVANGANGFDFYYAACDQTCAQPEQWNLVHVTSNSGSSIIEFNDDERAQRSFALDPEGRPRFVYIDRSNSHLGTFYAYCDSGCSERSGWSEVRINKDNGNTGNYRDEDLIYPVLTFTRDGRPRVLADGTTLQDEFFLHFVACDVDCHGAQNWQSLALFERGSGARIGYDIAADAHGRLRVVFYDGARLGGAGQELTYAWCNDACLQIDSWQRYKIGLAQRDGQEPDLILDGAGRPHIAYVLYGNGGLGYSTCSSQCEAGTGGWTHKVVESRADLMKAWTLAYPPHCDGGIWDGVTPSITSDWKGRLYIGYDATYHARCFYKDETKQWEPHTQFHLVWRAARLVILAQTPGDPGAPTPTPTATSTRTSTPTLTPTPTATPTGTTVVTPVRLGSGFFPEERWHTQSSEIAVSGNGVVHMAYVYYEPTAGPDPQGGANPTSAVYRVCSENCGQSSGWSSVALGENVSEVQLALTPAGQPRLLLLIRAQESWGRGDRYVYAACDQLCAQAQQWQMVTVVTVPNDLSWQMTDVREMQARGTFTLDSAGRPRFVFYHYNTEVDPTGVGAYYASCDSACTQSTSWALSRFTRVFDSFGELQWEILERPVLMLTGDDRPRILALFVPTGFLRFPGLYYLSCDVLCDDEENWQKALVGQSGDQNGDWDLALDGSDRPRAVIAPWSTHALRYLWCNSECHESFNWERDVDLGLESNADNGPDLVLDSLGRPWIGYATVDYDSEGNNGADSLHLAWCDSGCETVDGQWRDVRVENGFNLQVEWGGGQPQACLDGRWGGRLPSLAAGSGEKLWLAYDSYYIAPCRFDSESGGWVSGAGQYSTVWRASRIVGFTRP